MAATPSTMLPLGTKAPDFTLTDVVTGKAVAYHELSSDVGTVVVFICNHCPYVLHIEPELLKISREYKENGIAFIAISSNDVEQYPQDSPEKMKEMAISHNFGFPYLYDETQEVAKAFQAACTPDFYLFDGSDKLVYRGRMDGSTPKNDVPLTGNELREALNSLLSGGNINENQTPSIGCNIKWKK